MPCRKKKKKKIHEKKGGRRAAALTGLSSVGNMPQHASLQAGVEKLAPSSGLVGQRQRAAETIREMRRLEKRSVHPWRPVRITHILFCLFWKTLEGLLKQNRAGQSRRKRSVQALDTVDLSTGEHKGGSLATRARVLIQTLAIRDPAGQSQN